MPSLLKKKLVIFAEFCRISVEKPNACIDAPMPRVGYGHMQSAVNANDVGAAGPQITI